MKTQEIVQRVQARAHQLRDAAKRTNKLAVAGVLVGGLVVLYFLMPYILTAMIVWAIYRVAVTRAKNPPIHIDAQGTVKGDEYQGKVYFQ